ncbi:2'-5' RNA ligase family protein [Catalinimonas sp. 4WD22]|uniref:2'-5' RNA ligase family protein n=1 Tax=Catalinimonas locisalis TaxID=3133978 RepID=UPI00310122BF
MSTSNEQHNYAPLILSLRLDEDSQIFFNQLRKRYFPPERNYLDAHLTLFHHLPGEEIRNIKKQLREVSTTTSIFPLEVTKVKMIGRGVAHQLESDALMKMHKELARQWQKWLTPQDSQKLWPHITGQNKVDPDKAKMLYEKLSDSFEPLTAYATGLSLWAYQNGPWKHKDEFSFR